MRQNSGNSSQINKPQRYSISGRLFSLYHLDFLTWGTSMPINGIRDHALFQGYCNHLFLQWCRDRERWGAGQEWIIFFQPEGHIAFQGDLLRAESGQGQIQKQMREWMYCFLLHKTASILLKTASITRSGGLVALQLLLNFNSHQSQSWVVANGKLWPSNVLRTIGSPSLFHTVPSSIFIYSNQLNKSCQSPKALWHSLQQAALALNPCPQQYFPIG